jgi:hypothetical protein
LLLHRKGSDRQRLPTVRTGGLLGGELCTASGIDMSGVDGNRSCQLCAHSVESAAAAAAAVLSTYLGSGYSRQLKARRARRSGLAAVAMAEHGDSQAPPKGGGRGQCPSEHPIEILLSRGPKGSWHGVPGRLLKMAPCGSKPRDGQLLLRPPETTTRRPPPRGHGESAVKRASEMTCTSGNFDIVGSRRWFSSLDNRPTYILCGWRCALLAHACILHAADSAEEE